MSAEIPAGGRSFHTTRWSIIRAAHGSDDVAARGALRVLCEAYWYPLYAFARRRGRAPEDALDLTQGFFAALLERPDLGGADPDRGRFRSYLLGAFRHHVSGEDRRAAAAKRGGGQALLSLDATDAEGRYLAQPADGETPERAFDRAWAEALLARSLASLCEEYEGRGQAATFDALRDRLAPGGEPRPLGEVAAELGVSGTAAKVAAHRLRRRFAEAVRTEITATVEDPAGVAEELEALFRALGPAENPGAPL